MLLGHITSRKSLDHIIQNGLIREHDARFKEIDLGTELNALKPKEAKPYMDMTNCLWFHPGNTMIRWVAGNDQVHLAVEPHHLEQEKLYYVDGRLTEKLKQPMNADKKRKMLKKYWQELKPFSDYMILHGEKDLIKRHFDVVYFADIPRDFVSVYLGE